MIALILALATGQVSLQNEGSSLGQINVLNCVGTAVECSRLGTTGTITIDAGTGGGSAYTLPALTATVLGGVSGNGSLTCTGTDKLSGFTGAGAMICSADSSGAGTVTTSGAPASTYIARFTSGTAITGDANFTYDATNKRLGIGISPTQPLHIKGNAVNEGLLLENSSGVGSIILAPTAGAAAFNPLVADGSNVIAFGNFNNVTRSLFIVPWSTASAGLALTPTGFLGINKIPLTALDVSGAGTFSSTVTASGFVGNASTATALAANPTDCSVAGEFATGIAANGNLTCAAPSSGSGNSVEASLAITDVGVFSATVAATWVAAGTEIVCSPFATDADGQTVEIYDLAEFSVTASNRVAGVSFDLRVYSPNGVTGIFRFHCLGV